ncbi:type I-C CRISPR-associated protein Cas8c/Csd1 [Parabacteroides distasonis]|uniref:type I-C CRISPR-associated protein Cas8c/Csd1 n=2 Tax=Parabacteroides distasonis TaxID=823 RepID=UPI00189E3333|nr:type I-C CRISPR-associated protein Cas8c/Csd1 [Parabacteroides distasonis]MDB9151780.1 type I-C CRISPR-associated protein Cas8c/Csd1 [Parabacteroides distasonis]MDB9156450.1 type I-C CRISPR-associated protein Cas8c/Csd1 [Parabacteroides distasonis]MDB9165464.1 type I-C CRISPR-associated protein Cas8c/Csd1 [Parabacteroides distasonis]MDB9169869.1 type I-C CRISPR-associated protein Cas8c/Csd1 [Parabacteroides distasonis]MDB9192853.1 type I-C CRISPR-associated protein Cas8c/Csd1 [Parabacteroid
MILKALYDYYNRNSKELAPLHLSYEEYFFAIIIDCNGNFLRIEDLHTNEGDGTCILTLRPEERTSAPIPHFLGDKGSYVLGLNNVKITDNFDYKKEYKANSKNHNSFIFYINKLQKDNPENETLKAIKLFYDNDLCCLYEKLHLTPIWKELVSCLGKNITFRLNGSMRLAVEEESLFSEVINSKINENKKQICLITGEKSKPVSNTYSSFILGGKSNGKLVSFQIKSGYDSYGKISCLNSPISEEAEFKYTTALLHLLRKGSNNKFVIGSQKNKTVRTFLFWASSNSEAAKKSEDSLFALLGRTEENDDPNMSIELVRRTFMSIYNGVLFANKDDKFFILGLAPNSARIAVVYWNELPLREFAGLISKHFADMEIVDTRKDKKPYVGLHSILGNVTLGGKSSDATPNLPDAVVKSIFQGLPYPASLFQACIRRIRAEQSVNIGRAAIIKAYLNRLNDNNNNKKLDIMLDKENQNQGYLCGRLFAVLENLQYAANKQDTIRSSYMNAASATPSAVFSTILKLSNSHYSKLLKDKKGLANFFDNQKKEIIALIHDFPNTLDLNDQGRFFLGYYHQKNHREYKETEE